jgi:hypothetical protein
VSILFSLLSTTLSLSFHSLLTYRWLSFSFTYAHNMKVDVIFSGICIHSHVHVCMIAKWIFWVICNNNSRLYLVSTVVVSMFVSSNSYVGILTPIWWAEPLGRLLGGHEGGHFMSDISVLHIWGPWEQPSSLPHSYKDHLGTRKWTLTKHQIWKFYNLGLLSL